MQDIRRTGYIVLLVVIWLSFLTACGSQVESTKATLTPLQSNLTLITTLQRGEVFVGFGTSIVIRQPDNAGSKKTLLSIKNGVLVYGIPASETQARLIVDMSPDVQRDYEIVDNSTDFAKVYCAGRNRYPNTKPAVMNLPGQWDVSC